MDLLDKQIKSFLEKESNALSRPVNSRWVPSTEDFYEFITDRLEGKELDNFLDYLRRSPEAQSLVAQARSLLLQENEAEKESVPAEWLKKAQGAVLKGSDIHCPHCGKTITPFKKPVTRQNFYNLLWLLTSIAAFLASFYFHRYFYQCLALALFAGIKWVFDRRATRTQILIYKALKDEHDPVRSKDLHNHSSHL